MYRALLRVLAFFGERIAEFNDRYQLPMPGGYRDLQLVVCFEGHMCELQLSTEPMARAKMTTVCACVYAVVALAHMCTPWPSTPSPTQPLESRSITHGDKVGLAPCSTVVGALLRHRVTATLRWCASSRRPSRRAPRSASRRRSSLA
eukprot:6171044-Prymnesium_polylepis.1